MKHILYWLGGFAVALGIFQYYETHRYSEDQLIYAQPPQNRTAVADFDALAYLNFLRASANLPALAHSATLERAARNHARYLLQNPDDGHDEHNTRNPFYTGPRPSDRTRKAGYAYKGVHENVSTGQHPPNEKINDHLPAQHQLDNLMTAIYHRFSLLDQNIDEAGAAFESQGKQIALSINQGDSRFNSLCQKTAHYPTSAVRFIKMPVMAMPLFMRMKSPTANSGLTSPIRKAISLRRFSTASVPTLCRIMK